MSTSDNENQKHWSSTPSVSHRWEMCGRAGPRSAGRGFGGRRGCVAVAPGVRAAASAAFALLLCHGYWSHYLAS